MDNSISSGSLVNGPMWWIDPTNPDAMGIDTRNLKKLYVFLIMIIHNYDY